MLPFANFKDCMTNEMLEVYEDFFNEERLKKEFLHAQEMYLRARKAGDVALPMKNEAGISVRQGARLAMYQIERYWESRRDEMIQYLSIEWVNENIIT